MPNCLHEAQCPVILQDMLESTLSHNDELKCYLCPSSAFSVWCMQPLIGGDKVQHSGHCNCIQRINELLKWLQWLSWNNNNILKSDMVALD